MNFFKLLVATIVLASSFECEAPPEPNANKSIGHRGLPVTAAVPGVGDGWVQVAVGGARREPAEKPVVDTASLTEFPPLGLLGAKSTRVAKK